MANKEEQVRAQIAKGAAKTSKKIPAYLRYTLALVWVIAPITLIATIVGFIHLRDKISTDKQIRNVLIAGVILSIVFIIIDVLLYWWLF